MNGIQRITINSESIDWAALLESIAGELLGDPNHALSRESELRYGGNGSLSVDLDRGVWYDHEEGRGGGTLDLVMRELECDRAGALEWLRDRGHLPGRIRRPHHRDSNRVRRRPRSSAPSPPRTRSSDAKAKSARIIHPLWSASIPADATPGGSYLHERGACPAWEYGITVSLPPDVRWLSRERAPRPDLGASWIGLPDGLAGALLFALRPPGSDELGALAVEGLDAQGRQPDDRWRRTFGAARGTLFEARAGAGDANSTVHVVEGSVDALALMWAPWLDPPGGRVIAMGGTSGFAALRAADVPRMIGAATTVVLHPDGDPAGLAAAVQAQVPHIQVPRGGRAVSGAARPGRTLPGNSTRG